eukprot:CAMPEP_0174255016 /NCGR_PEP_ID=MMETSP0439-20130205/4347_1 /TAXON_ID=0 /ORGANISM="Stereomyxa ramosa, Strain Chinc5" /LENGTH=292 /DNA_ID=CAMNT_0015336969 /DNA_START=31 /DNA_END=906 /DNA_ORIENTATION=+
MSELELRKLKELIAEVEAKEGKKVVVHGGEVRLIEAKRKKLSVKMGLPAIHYLNNPAFSDCVLLLKKVPYCGDYSRIYHLTSRNCIGVPYTPTSNTNDSREDSDELMVIPAHTQYLTLRSKLFENLFSSSFYEPESRVVDLSEISFPEVFLEVLLPFLYTGVLAMKFLEGKEDKFLEMVAIADYFDLDQAFEDQCRSFFVKNHTTIRDSPLFIHKKVPFWLFSKSYGKIPAVDCLSLFLKWAHGWLEDKTQELVLLSSSYLRSLVELDWADLAKLQTLLPESVGFIPSVVVW